MKVGVFERLDHLGGGAITEDLPSPGFRGNFCAHFTRFYGHPAYKEFNLREEGLEYTFPDTNEAIIFDDGTSYIAYAAFTVVDPKTGETKYNEANVKKTYEQIKRFSKVDAETYLDLTEKYRTKWRGAFHKYRYSPPTPWGTPDPLEALFDDPDSGLELPMQFMTCKQIARYFFESDELRILTLRGFLTSWGCFPEDVPGIMVTIATIHLTLGWETAAIAKGGTQAITNSLVSVGKKMGIEYHINSEVQKILIENGTAKGVKLLDGSEVKARQLVVSDNASPQLFQRLIGEDKITDVMKRKARVYQFDRGELFWGTVGVHELPKYKAAKDNPDINATPRTYFAPKDLGFIEDKYQHEIYLLGIPSKMFILTAPDSIWDPSRVPAGKHSLHVEEFTCPARLFSRKEWKQMTEQFVDVLFEVWQEYAPNMTKDNLIVHRITNPADIQDTHLDMKEGGWCEGNMAGVQNGRFRGIPGGYKTFVKNLYQCSSGVYGGPGIGRGSSYNCYKVIAQELGLAAPKF
jgi:phytoene dehydrogenase-like protein